MADPDESDAMSRYFLNDLPSKLYDVQTANDRHRRWDQYRGGGILLSDCDEFDFS